MRELGNKAKDLTVRINFIVDKLIFHQFGNYVLQKMIYILTDTTLLNIILLRVS